MNASYSLTSERVSEIYSDLIRCGHPRRTLPVNGNTSPFCTGEVLVFGVWTAAPFCPLKVYQHKEEIEGLLRQVHSDLSRHCGVNLIAASATVRGEIWTSGETSEDREKDADRLLMLGRAVGRVVNVPPAIYPLRLEMGSPNFRLVW